MQTRSYLALVAAGLMLGGCAQEPAPPADMDGAAAADAAAAGSADAAQDIAAAAAPAELTAGDPEAGKRIYIYCQSCHSINAGGSNKVGPNLHGILGSPAAQVDGFVYSEPLQSSGIVWTAEALDQWVTAPSKMVPGTTMLFAGITVPQQRADLIAYLQQMSAATN